MASPGSAGASPLGIVLAGGAGRRLGGDKATVPLAGRPLIVWACDALRAVLGDVAVVAKPETKLPELAGVAVWREPAEPRHPLFGLVWALEHAGGRPIVVCAGDLPLVGTELVARLAVSPTRVPGTRVRLAGADGRLQPLLGRYEPAALPPLRDVLASDPQVSLTLAVRALDPVVHEAPAEALVNVNTPDDLRHAAAVLARRTPAVNGG